MVDCGSVPATDATKTRGAGGGSASAQELPERTLLPSLHPEESLQPDLEATSAPASASSAVCEVAAAVAEVTEARWPAKAEMEG